VLTVVDGSGCVAVDSTEIVVIRTLAIPNAFTPNGDGLNDFFIIRSPYVDQFALRIYNRWGQEVFATNDINIGWDGTFAGKEQEVGTYLYFLDALGIEGEVFKRTGTITLAR
jgi:gliding motility-associated-like protein